MSAIPATVVSPAVSVARSGDNKATAPDDSGQQFGGVLSREISKQEGAKTKQGETAEKDDSAVVKDAIVQGTTDQQDAAAPWLLMLQQLGQSIPVQLPQAQQAVAADNVDPKANQENPLLQLSSPGVVPAAGTAVSSQNELPVKNAQPVTPTSLPGATEVQTPHPLAANMSTDIGKELPLALGATDKKLNFVDALGDSLGKVSDVQAQQLLHAASQKNEQGAVVERGAVSQYRVSEPVGDARWGEVVTQRVSMMLGRQEQQMVMQLNPPHLGPMEVHLTLGQDQASVVFSSQHAAVREALAAATPRLTALLADQGIQLVNVHVASDSLQQQAQQQAQEQSRNQASSHHQGEGARNAFLSEMDTPLDIRSLKGLDLPVARSGVSLYI
ncbi:MAG: flagellar hook-length control protein FliK [Formivibrio sp.]|nr:flagellar hook-length control protein FliK [Formivibrio sp.]